MAPVNALLDIAPPRLREALLTAYLDRLMRPTDVTDVKELLDGDRSDPWADCVDSRPPAGGADPADRLRDLPRASGSSRGGEDAVRDLLERRRRTAPGGRLPGARRAICPASPASARTPGTGCSAARGRPSCTRSSSWRAPSTRAVSTPGDLLFHIRAGRLDLCFELAAQIMKRLGDAATVVDEVHGFKYFDERDLLGFVDGTENPTGADADEAVLIGAEDPEFAGGSYVIVQKYLHDMTAWNALTVEQQERVIGRTKLERHRAGRRRQALQLARRADTSSRMPTATSCRSCATTCRSARSAAGSSAPTSSATPATPPSPS